MCALGTSLFQAQLQRRITLPSHELADRCPNLPIPICCIGPAKSGAQRHRCMPQGGELTIRTAAIAHGVEVSVADTGSGLTPRMRAPVTPY